MHNAVLPQEAKEMTHLTSSAASGGWGIVVTSSDFASMLRRC